MFINIRMDNPHSVIKILTLNFVARKTWFFSTHPGWISEAIPTVLGSVVGVAG